MNKDMMLPYEKSEVYGLESLTDTELLAIIIRSGTKGCDCIQAAKMFLMLRVILELSGFMIFRSRICVSWKE